MKFPVVLFVYNRPDHTRRTVEALAANLGAGQASLTIFSDGPRDEAARPAVEAVRTYVRGVAELGSFGAVRIVERADNLGLAASVRSGVTEVLKEHEGCIVLEDDLVTAPDFLQFMTDCLEHYRDDPTVGSISGYSALQALPSDYPHDVYAIPRTCSTGWATWRDRWSRVDWTLSAYPSFAADRSLQLEYAKCGSDRPGRLRRQFEQGVKSWSAVFGFSQFLQGYNTIYPAVNRLIHIGDDGSGENALAGTAYNDDIPLEPRPYVLTSVTPDGRIMRAVSRAYSGGLATRIAGQLRRLGLGAPVSVVKRWLGGRS